MVEWKPTSAGFEGHNRWLIIAYSQYHLPEIMGSRLKIFPIKQIILLAGFLGMLTACQGGYPTPHPGPTDFNADRAYRDIVQQLEFGPRAPGMTGHRQVRQWLIDELKDAGWQVETQSGTYRDKEVHNVIAYRQEGGAYLLLGAHYDTRLKADQDPDPEKRSKPVPGANDGASGVAVLLELARSLPEPLDMPVRLVFFDAEDNGDLQGWDWIMGSSMYVKEMEQPPQAVVILDMVGDKELNLHLERSSTPDLQEEIWDIAHELGYESSFRPTLKYTILDDHTPFLREGIPAVDVIDFDYPFWHTTEDTVDKVSAHSLEVVGETMLAWIRSRQPQQLE